MSKKKDHPNFPSAQKPGGTAKMPGPKGTDTPGAMEPIKTKGRWRTDNPGARFMTINEEMIVIETTHELIMAADEPIVTIDELAVNTDDKAKKI